MKRHHSEHEMHWQDALLKLFPYKQKCHKSLVVEASTNWWCCWTSYRFYKSHHPDSDKSIALSDQHLNNQIARSCIKRWKTCEGACVFKRKSCHTNSVFSKTRKLAYAWLDHYFMYRSVSIWTRTSSKKIMETVRSQYNGMWWNDSWYLNKRVWFFHQELYHHIPLYFLSADLLYLCNDS